MCILGKCSLCRSLSSYCCYLSKCQNVSGCFCKTVEIIWKWYTYIIFRFLLTICLNDIGYTDFSINCICSHSTQKVLTIKSCTVFQLPFRYTTKFWYYFLRTLAEQYFILFFLNFKLKHYCPTDCDNTCTTGNDKQILAKSQNVNYKF